MSHALAEHPSLQELNLAKNHIGQVGAVKCLGRKALRSWPPMALKLGSSTSYA